MAKIYDQFGSSWEGLTVPFVHIAGNMLWLVSNIKKRKACGKAKTSGEIILKRFIKTNE